jgi:hypothetical protein
MDPTETGINGVVKAMLSLCLITHNAMKTYGAVESELHAILTLH